MYSICNCCHGDSNSVILSWLQLQCCGVNNYTDWYGIKAWPKDNFVPDSCCEFETTLCGRKGRPSDWHTRVRLVVIVVDVAVVVHVLVVVVVVIVVVIVVVHVVFVVFVLVLVLGNLNCWHCIGQAGKLFPGRAQMIYSEVKCENCFLDIVVSHF